MSVGRLRNASLIAVTSMVGAAGGMDIIFNVDPSVTPDALAGFESAATYWESQFSDPIDVYFDISLADLGPGVLGGASSNSAVFTTSSIFGALGADSSTAADATAVANLPTLTGAGGFNFFTQEDTEGGSLAVSLDDDDSANNLFLDVNRANAKALGWVPGVGDETSPDADITFSSTFAWDFDRSDGISGGFDFIGVAIHEIGHALGFVSGVDIVDLAVDGIEGADPPFDAPFDIDGFAIYSVLDLFRYSAEGELNLAVGGDPYFSIDGGTTDLGTLSTGTANGDGRQASHWEDNLDLGIMDPTFAPGEFGDVTALDLLAFDVIGYDLVPEPSVALLALGGLLFWRRRR